MQLASTAARARPAPHSATTAVTARARPRRKLEEEDEEEDSTALRLAQDKEAHDAFAPYARDFELDLAQQKYAHDVDARNAGLELAQEKYAHDGDARNAQRTVERAVVRTVDTVSSDFLKTAPLRLHLIAKAALYSERIFLDTAQRGYKRASLCRKRVAHRRASLLTEHGLRLSNGAFQPLIPTEPYDSGLSQGTGWAPICVFTVRRTPCVFTVRRTPCIYSLSLSASCLCIYSPRDLHSPSPSTSRAGLLSRLFSIYRQGDRCEHLPAGLLNTDEVPAYKLAQRTAQAHSHGSRSSDTKPDELRPLSLSQPHHRTTYKPPRAPQQALFTVQLVYY